MGEKEKDNIPKSDKLEKRMQAEQSERDAIHKLLAEIDQHSRLVSVNFHDISGSLKARDKALNEDLYILGLKEKKKHRKHDKVKQKDSTAVVNPGFEDIVINESSPSSDKDDSLNPEDWKRRGKSTYDSYVNQKNKQDHTMLCQSAIAEITNAIDIVANKDKPNKVELAELFKERSEMRQTLVKDSFYKGDKEGDNLKSKQDSEVAKTLGSHSNSDAKSIPEIILSKKELEKWINAISTIKYSQSLEDRAKAKKACDAVIKDHPKDKSLLNNLGNVLEEVSGPDAIDTYSRVVKIDPNDPEGYLNLGHAQLTFDKYPEAIDSFSSAIKLSSEKANLYDIYDMRGRAYLENKDYPNAIKDSTEAIKLAIAKGIKGAELAQMFDNRATVYGALGQTANSETDRQKAEKLRGE